MAVRVLACAAAALALACAPAAPRAGTPNVLLYVVDTLRADALGCYGHPGASTPRVDAFAAGAIVFENAVASAPWTRPAMASLLTGLHPPHHATEGRRAVLPDDVPTLAQRLRARGLATGYVTANPNAGSFFGFGRGFDDVFELYERRRAGVVSGRELIARSDAVTETALRWVAGARRPFLLVTLSIDPHAPYDPPARLAPAWARRGERADDAGRLRALYDAEVSANDGAFGALLDGLAAAGELERTLVIFTGDHGEELGEHGRRGHGDSLAEEALRVPLVIRPPGGAAGVRVRETVSAVDVVATILDAVGADDATLDGRPLLPSVAAPARPALSFLRADGHDLASASDGRFKLVWDRARDAVALHELAPADAAPGPPPAHVRARLLAALAAFEPRPPRERADAPETPEALGEALGALGYRR